MYCLIYSHIPSCRYYPQLKQTFRFHIDTWCMGKSYLTVGDCGGFSGPTH